MMPDITVPLTTEQTDPANPAVQDEASPDAALALAAAFWQYWEQRLEDEQSELALAQAVAFWQYWDPIKYTRFTPDTPDNKLLSAENNTHCYRPDLPLSPAPREFAQKYQASTHPQLFELLGKMKALAQLIAKANDEAEQPMREFEDSLRAFMNTLENQRASFSDVELYAKLCLLLNRVGANNFQNLNLPKTLHGFHHFIEAACLLCDYRASAPAHAPIKGMLEDIDQHAHQLDEASNDWTNLLKAYSLRDQASNIRSKLDVLNSFHALWYMDEAALWAKLADIYHGDGSVDYQRPVEYQVFAELCQILPVQVLQQFFNTNEAAVTVADVAVPGSDSQQSEITPSEDSAVAQTESSTDLALAQAAAFWQRVEKNVSFDLPVVEVLANVVDNQTIAQPSMGDKARKKRQIRALLSEAQLAGLTEVLPAEAKNFTAKTHPLTLQLLDKIRQRADAIVNELSSDVSAAQRQRAADKQALIRQACDVFCKTLKNSRNIEGDMQLFNSLSAVVSAFAGGRVIADPTRTQELFWSICAELGEHRKTGLFAGAYNLWGACNTKSINSIVTAIREISQEPKAKLAGILPGSPATSSPTRPSKGFQAFLPLANGI